MDVCLSKLLGRFEKKKLLSLKNIETEIDDGTVSGLIDRLHIDETEFVR